MAPNQTALTAPGTYASTAAASYTWQSVTPGLHTFSAQLVTNTDTPLSVPPAFPAIDQVTVTVK